MKKLLLTLGILFFSQAGLLGMNPEQYNFQINCSNVYFVPTVHNNTITQTATQTNTQNNLNIPANHPEDMAMAVQLFATIHKSLELYTPQLAQTQQARHALFRAQGDQKQFNRLFAAWQNFLTKNAEDYNALAGSRGFITHYPQLSEKFLYFEKLFFTEMTLFKNYLEKGNQYESLAKKYPYPCQNNPRCLPFATKRDEIEHYNYCYPFCSKCGLEFPRSEFNTHKGWYHNVRQQKNNHEKRCKGSGE